MTGTESAGRVVGGKTSPLLRAERGPGLGRRSFGRRVRYGGLCFTADTDEARCTGLLGSRSRETLLEVVLWAGST